MPIISKRKLITNVAAYAPAAAGAWTPASVTTAFWFDADDAATITASGGLVSQWNDKSGNARHATQATGGNKFTDTASVQNGKHGLLSVRASATNMKTGSFAVNQAFIVAAAIKVGTIVDFDWIFDGALAETGTRSIFFANRGDVPGPALYAGADLTGSPQLSNGTAYYLVATFNGGSSTIRKNGSPLASGAAGAAAISGLVIGSSSGPLNGYFLELFCIPGSSGTDITNAETYLAAKWAI